MHWQNDSPGWQPEAASHLSPLRPSSVRSRLHPGDLLACCSLSKYGLPSSLYWLIHLIITSPIIQLRPFDYLRIDTEPVPDYSLNREPSIDAPALASSAEIEHRYKSSQTTAYTADQAPDTENTEGWTYTCVV
ncbi:hypothetical protein P170DRAFT_476594 [Aspergillus steynii IBT 23096]|uniref:Uncharacterized protein n=1 Tax=Aspergillus steynii IBT 23096 TaxID=1392250 RepID=A0A2I2G4Y6_9EURO|nr:uncharacterized protein P170DRAFT_476594 [Aspergillus steynii IBT 23096]PLB47941.1 hypothetical protein P170DRAFT_476594 [Aspergillus steynii IBT 23096]